MSYADWNDIYMQLHVSAKLLMIMKYYAYILFVIIAISSIELPMINDAVKATENIIIIHCIHNYHFYYYQC